MNTHVSTGPAPCHHGAGAEFARPVRDLPGLAASDPQAQSLDADGETFALMLPVFGRVVATTSGPHALLSETGGYGPAQLAGRLPRPAPGRISMRFASGHGEHLAHSPADPAQRRPAALHLFDRHGRLAHRTEIVTPEDMITLSSMVSELGPRPLERQAEPPPAPGLPYLPAIRAARDSWWAAHHFSHQDAILPDGGTARLMAMPHLPAGAARRIAPAVLAAFLDHLCHRAQSFSRSVYRPGCQQCHAGPVSSLQREGDLVLMRSGASLMALAPRAVRQCWLTRQGYGAVQLMVLELYDAAGLCIATFGNDPAAGSIGRAEWNRLLAALPDA